MTGSPSDLPPGLAPEVRAWLSQNFDHTSTRQRSQADTAKLLVTFALGVSATIVATALQVDETSGWLCLAATGLLAVAFAAAIVVIARDRVREPNRTGLMDRLARQPRPTPVVLDLLTEMELDKTAFNDEILERIRTASIVQLALSAAAATVAAVSLLLTKT